MQSHASRHVVSEFLKDLHPDLSAPFPKAVIEDEIAVAYGRRSIPKLISVLALPGLPEEDRAHALRVFNGLLSTQEHKTCAINEGAAEALTALVNSSPDVEVRRLSCEALASMAQIVPGRLAVVAAAGLAALTKALQTTPEAAAGALRQFSTSVDGVRLLGEVFHEVVPALVAMVAQPKKGPFTCKACENAAATLAGITTIEDGIVAALKSHVPRSMVALGNRGLSGEFRFEPKLMDMLEQVASCLEQICHHPYGKTAVREADGIRVLGEMLGLQHRPTVHKSVLALMAVSIEKESKVPTMNSAGINLVKLLKGNDEELAANARSALKNVAEHLEARRAVDMLLALEEREGTLFRGPEPPTPPDYRYLVTLPYPKNDEELLQRYGKVPAR